jgi:nucleoside-diphosphate-sugar epimerase
MPVQPTTFRSSRLRACAMAYVAVVTGATGFVGTELVKQLLERGWTVRATVRDASDAKRVEPLLRLAAALPGAVHLYEADLLREGSFHAACKGADFVFHCASPFVIDVADPVRQLIEPAVTGTRNVMLACAAAGPPLQRVVVTSSVAGAPPHAAAARSCRVPRRARCAARVRRR